LLSLKECLTKNRNCRSAFFLILSENQTDKSMKAWREKKSPTKLILKKNIKWTRELEKAIYYIGRI